MLPFTRQQFLAVFADYNDAIWPVQIVAFVLGLLAVAGMLRGTVRRSRIVRNYVATATSEVSAADLVSQHSRRSGPKTVGGRRG